MTVLFVGGPHDGDMRVIDFIPEVGCKWTFGCRTFEAIYQWQRTRYGYRYVFIRAATISNAD